MSTQKHEIVLSASDQTRDAFASAQKSMEGLANATNKGFSPATSNAIKNASYQISDFVSQVQGGQKVSLALSQQLPQLLAGFGAFGAVAGIVAGVFPSIVNAFTNGQNEAKKLDSAVGDLNGAIGEVGKASREFTMDNLYQEFNRANAGTRSAIIEQVKFQKTMIETQQMLAEKSLGKTLEGLGNYTFLDKLKGAYADTGAEKLSKELGVSVELAKDLLPSIKGLRDGTEDAGNFMARFGTALAASANTNAQKLVGDVKAVADGGMDAAAAQSRLSEALDKMGKAGDKGAIALEKLAKAQKAIDPFKARDEAVMRAYKEAEAAADADVEIERRKQARIDAVISQTSDGRLAKLQAELSDAAALVDEKLISPEQWQEFAQLRIDAFDKVKDGAKEVASTIDTVITNAFQGMADTIADFVLTGKASFGDLVNAMIRDLIRLEIQTKATSIWKELGGFEGVFKKIAGAFAGGGDAVVESANGNAFSGVPSLSAYSGSVVDRPTLFPFARGAGLMGEAGPEGIFPLKRGRDGKLGISAEGGGSNTNVTINVDASGTRSEGNAGAAGELGRRIETAVRSVIMVEKRPGGLLA